MHANTLYQLTCDTSFHHINTIYADVNKNQATSYNCPPTQAHTRGTTAVAKQYDVTHLVPLSPHKATNLAHILCGLVFHTAIKPNRLSDHDVHHCTTKGSCSECTTVTKCCSNCMQPSSWGQGSQRSVKTQVKVPEATLSHYPSMVAATQLKTNA